MNQKRGKDSSWLQEDIESADSIQCKPMNIKRILKNNDCPNQCQYERVSLNKASYDRLERYSLLLPDVMLALFLFCLFLLVGLSTWGSADKESLPTVPVGEQQQIEFSYSD